MLKWLDIPGLCASIIRDCGEMPREAYVSEVNYFSALARHMEFRNPGIVKRHETFIEALKNADVTVHLAAFKKTAKGHEEKETDVAIAVALLELFHTDAADCAFIMSGDTDLMPALRAVRRMYPGAYSEGLGPPIPTEEAHLFRRKGPTRSNPRGPPIPREEAHPFR